MRKPTERQEEYWENVLRDHRLGMGRGSTSKLVYSGDLNTLEEQEKDITGRVKPSGAGPD